MDILTKKILIICLLLNGCSVLEVNKNLFIQSFIIPNKIVVNSAITDLPYATSIFQYNNEDEFLAVLGKERGGKLYWFGSKNIKLTTSNGTITHSDGLKYDFIIKSYYFNKYDLKSKRSTIEFLDPPSGPLSIYYNYEEIEEGEIASLLTGDLYRYRLIKESFNVPGILWKGENYYWLDSDNHVMSSSQEISPYGDVINFKLIKKYSE